MNEVEFTPKTDIEEYLNNAYNIHIYYLLTGKLIRKERIGSFDPLEFFNLLYRESEFIKVNTDKPLSIVKKLRDLKYKKKQLFLFLWVLLELLEKDNATLELKTCLKFIEKEHKKLGAELFPNADKNPFKIKSTWSFDEVKFHMKTLPDTKAKIKYLTVIKTAYQQDKGSAVDSGTPFDHKCELEIKKLKAIAELEPSFGSIETKPQFKLTNKKGTRIDFIRILNAVYELRLIMKLNGQIPNKEEFMKHSGSFFGIDLSEYESDLSQALNNTKLEANLKIFEEMKSITQKSHYIGKSEK